jgi:DNA-binding NtrC family response regulator
VSAFAQSRPPAHTRSISSTAELRRFAEATQATHPCQALDRDRVTRLNAEQISIPTIFITGHGDARMRLQALRTGAVEFLAKPFDDEVLLETVHTALAR